jgi:hypothetical protein
MVKNDIMTLMVVSAVGEGGEAARGRWGYGNNKSDHNSTFASSLFKRPPLQPHLSFALILISVGRIATRLTRLYVLLADTDICVLG